MFNQRLVKCYNCFSSTSLMSVLEYFHMESFDWQHGYTLVEVIFLGRNSQRDVLVSTLRE